MTRAAEEQEKPHGAASSVKPQHGRVTGILIAKDDKSITVKAEGAQESTRYLLPTPGGSKTDVRAALKPIFVPNLVAIEWETQTEPVVTGISAIRPKQRTGVVTGTIVAQASGKREVYIDVKPTATVSPSAIGLPSWAVRARTWAALTSRRLRRSPG